MSVPPDTQILVVGAGPTGLVSAITLAKLGLEVVVVDAALTNPVGSRASTIHSHTLELLDTIGLAKPLLRTGKLSKGIRFCGKSSTFIDFDVSQLSNETRFPTSVHIPQGELERLFRQRLASEGVRLVRNKKVIGLGHDIVSPGVELKFEDGSVIRTRYVIGADGSHSTIRRLAGIDFKDPHTGIDYNDANSSSMRMVLADVYLQEPLPASVPRDRLSLYVDSRFFLIPFSPPSPLPTGPCSFWRIGFGMASGSDDAPRLPPINYFQEQLDARNPWGTKVTISSVTDSSRYRVKSAVASTYFRRIGDGNILLAGDAAHVYSPAGGQGMNLGICDAIVLAHAIHSHIVANPDYKDFVLQDYADSRQIATMKVIDLVSNLTTLINAGTGWRRPFRDFVFWVARHLPCIGRMGALKISGIMNRT